jgi:ubiquinone/menaquinone biosynthesis C-methylase UbiE
MNAAPDQTLPPNHHGDLPGFSGIGGAVAGLTMLIRRGPLARRVADLAQVAEGDHVVDVGSGPGGAAREAARRGARVTGVEPADVMRRVAGWCTFGSPDIEWVEGVAEDLPLADGSATVLWSIATVHHWPDLDGGIAEAHRVLAPEGRLVFAERKSKVGATGLGSHGWTAAQADACAELLLEAGFAEAEVQEVEAGRPHLVLTATRP